MSFRPLLARAGAAAAAGGAALNQPAQARSAPIPQQQATAQQPYPDAKSLVDDEWTVAQFDKGDVIFLRPEEINQAADDFRHATYGMRSFDDHDETSSNESDERRATEVIELSESMHQASRHGTSTTHVNGEGVSLLLDLATEMLKRPAVQQEVMSIIADNPRLHRALLAPPPPSPARLGAPHPVLLLGAPPSPVVEELEDDAQAAGESHEGDAWHALLSNLQQTLSAMGSQLGGLRMRLAHWLRALLLGRDHECNKAHKQQPAAAEGGMPAGGDTMHPFLRAAMAVAVVLACVAMARRPGLAAAVAALAAKRAASRN